MKGGELPDGQWMGFMKTVTDAMFPCEGGESLPDLRIGDFTWGNRVWSKP